MNDRQRFAFNMLKRYKTVNALEIQWFLVEALEELCQLEIAQRHDGAKIYFLLEVQS